MATTADRLSKRLPGWSKPWSELAVRTVFDAFDDRVPGLSAEVAFYLILSLPPLLLTVGSAAALIGRNVLGLDNFAQETQDAVVDVVGAFLTPKATEDFAGIVTEAIDVASGSLLSIGFLVTVFTASRALRVLSVAIGIAYDLEDERPTWQQFVYGLLLTLGSLVVGIAVVPLFVAGPGFGDVIAEWAHLPGLFGDVYRVAYWPTAALVAVGLLAVLYHVAAPWWTPWRRDLPGALLGMAVGLLGSVGLRFYAAQAITGEQNAFGPLAAPLVILLWLYVVAFGILLGAELNAEIEKMWPTTEGPLPTDGSVVAGSVGGETGSQGEP